MFERTYEQHGDEGLVTIGDIRARVPHNNFWHKFAQGWEPDTERIYREFVIQGGTVLDVGAWIGSTILFALASGAAKVVAVEPNPGSFAALEHMLRINPWMVDRVTLVNGAISDEREVLSMGLVEGEDDTSTSGISGCDFQVQADTLFNLYQEHGIHDSDLVKIDIEGAELLLVDTLTTLSTWPGQVVHLSIHVPFFPKYGDLDGFIEAVCAFDIQDDRGTDLSADEFRERILIPDAKPAWGTKHGNFFEVLLQAR